MSSSRPSSTYENNEEIQPERRPLMPPSEDDLSAQKYFFATPRIIFVLCILLMMCLGGYIYISQTFNHVNYEDMYRLDSKLDLSPCSEVKPTEWKPCNMSLLPQDELEEILSDYIIECHSFQAPLDWSVSSSKLQQDSKEASFGRCDKTTPMNLWRLYSKKLHNRMHEAFGHFLYANPGGPGGFEFTTSGLKKAFLDPFMRSTYFNYVIYIQKVRGVGQEGAITCRDGTIPGSFVSQECLDYVTETFGEVMPYYGIVQQVYDIRYSLQVIRKTTIEVSKKAPVMVHYQPTTVFGVSSGTRVLTAYMANFEEREHFDQFVLDGISSMDYDPSLNTNSESNSIYLQQIMNACLFVHDCFKHFMGLTYPHGDEELPVVSLVELYEHLIGLMVEGKSKAVEYIQKWLGKEEYPVTYSEEEIVEALKRMFYEMTTVSRVRSLIAPFILRIYYAEHVEEKKHFLKDILPSLKTLLQSLKPGGDDSKPGEAPKKANPFIGVSQLINERYHHSDIQYLIDIECGQSSCSQRQLYANVKQGYIDLAKRMKHLRYKFDIESSVKRGKTSMPILILNGDMDPQTVMYAGRDRYGIEWLGSPDEHQYSFVLPHSVRSTVIRSSQTSYRPEFSCSMQLLSSFVVNNGDVLLKDQKCLRKPLLIDLAGSRNDTLEILPKVFRKGSLVWV